MSQYDQPSVLMTRAVSDFHDARRKAAMESIVGLVRRKPTELLSYDEVRNKLRALETARRQLEDIPLDSIIGSVNRYTDFSRSFLPRMESDITRWSSVRMGVETPSGLPPIEAYRIGEAYFVLDGHHRVSVARELGAETIQGYVVVVNSRVPLSPGDSPDDIILKAEYTDFLAQTHIDELRPGADLLVTAPGQYQKVLEHISVHQYLMGVNRGHEIAYPEAVAHWYDTVYTPVAELIRGQNLLRDFPDRSVTDLYLWIMEHRAALSGGELGWEVTPARAAADFTEKHSPTARRRLPRLARRLLDRLTPDPLEAGPPPGSWRSIHAPGSNLMALGDAVPHRGNRLFDDLLVTVTDSESGWLAVDAALEVARREEARLTGLHVMNARHEHDLALHQRLQDEFTRRCAQAGVQGRLLFEQGEIWSLICRRSAWMDLTVFRLSYPPPLLFFQRLTFGTRLLIRRCSSPLLAVPAAPFSLESALLLFGPGRKSEEALFVATYLAGAWNIPLTVLTVPGVNSAAPAGTAVPITGQAEPSLLDRARGYLESHGVQARFIEDQGEPARAALIHAEAEGCSFLIMGGYEKGPLHESLFGSTVDRVLRSTHRPVLICR